MGILDDDFLFDDIKEKESKLDKIKSKMNVDSEISDLEDGIIDIGLNEDYGNKGMEKNRDKEPLDEKDKSVKQSNKEKLDIPTEVVEREKPKSARSDKAGKVLDKMEDAFGMAFSDEQLEIIQHNGAPLNVLSGAGSGKTTVLVAKMLYREMVFGEKPLHMLAITFTAKARHEMEERYRKLRRKLKLRSKSLPTFRTFHALFLMLLQAISKYDKVKVLEGNKYWYQLSSMVVANEDNEKSNVLEAMFTYKGNLINKGLSKDGIEFADLYYDQSNIFKLENYIKVMEKYRDLKEDEGYIDFDDMQTIIYDEVVEEGNREPVDAFRRVWGDGSVYIDEYQDISKIQRIIMDALVKDFNRFTVIGDDDQSIYSWRGSDPSYIIDFPYHYKDADRLKLTVNYRCRGDILKPVLSSISKNKKRVEKDIKAHKDGGYVELLPITDSYEPLVDKLLKEVEGYEGIMFNEVAILVRQNSQRTIIADSLIERGLPVNIARESNSLQETALYKTIMEMIEMIKEKDNKLFVQHARKFVPQMSRGLIEKYNYKDETWYFDLCEQMFYNIKSDTVKLIQGIYKTNNMYNAVVLVWKLVNGYYRHITSKGYGSYERVTTTVKYIMDISRGVSIKDFKSIEERKKARIRLWVGSDEALKIDTLHSVKGLEFDTVYLIGIDGNIIPNMNRYNEYLKEGGQEHAEQYIEEERRLFYVGWTRAKERLIVSYNKNNPSIFLKELEI